MEQLYLKSECETDNEVKIDIYEQILSIYDGKMFVKLNSEIWLVNTISKYKNMYIEVLTKYIDILLKKGNYVYIQGLIAKALNINDKVAVFHYYAILTYCYQGKKEIAKSYLNRCKELFTDKEYLELTKNIKAAKIKHN